MFTPHTTSEDWLLNKWGKMIDGIYNPDSIPADMQERVKQIVTLFDNGMDLLRDPACMPNLNINKLCTLGWRLIGNRITPIATVEEMPLGHPNTLHFWAEIKPERSLGVVIVPFSWPQMCYEDRNMQLGGLVFTCSQIADYYHREMSRTSQKPMMERAHAWEAEFLLTVLANKDRFVQDGTGLTEGQHRVGANEVKLNSYQEETLRRYPKGLESLPVEYRYELKPFNGNNDFTILEAGECVRGRNG